MNVPVTNKCVEMNLKSVCEQFGFIFNFSFSSKGPVRHEPGKVIYVLILCSSSKWKWFVIKLYREKTNKQTQTERKLTIILFDVLLCTVEASKCITFNTNYKKTWQEIKFIMQ